MFENAAVEELVDGPACDLRSQGPIMAWETFFVREQELLEVVFKELIEGRSPGSSRPIG